jgi:SAM-dependent methyltransferase
MTVDDPLEVEFDTLADWTAEAIASLDPAVAVPAACRGSGSPAVLAWLADRLELGPDVRLLDTGAGVGGPAAWLREEDRASRIVVTDPMPGAMRAAARLFALPGAVAVSQALPFRSGSFGAAWALGVLSTTDEKAALLAEVARVLEPGGHLGVLAYLRMVERVPDAPEGNQFASEHELDDLLAGAGFDVVDTKWADELAGTPAPWRDAADAVADVVAAAHRDDEAWHVADDQETRFARLLTNGLVRAKAVSCRLADFGIASLKMSLRTCL